MANNGASPDNRYRAETELSREIWDNTIAADALAPCVDAFEFMQPARCAPIWLWHTSCYSVQFWNLICESKIVRILC